MKTFYFYAPQYVDGPQTLTNSEVYARNYAAKNMERVIVFEEDED